MIELTGEMPLLIFTEFAAISGGAFVALFIVFLRGGFHKDELRRIDIWTVFFLIIALVGLIASFFHLANPGNAMNVMNTIGRSPLANEILCFGIYFVLAIIYWIIGLAGGLKGSFRIVASGIVSAAAIVMVIYTGIAYLFPTVPPWNTGWTIVQMLGVLLFSGVVTGSYLLTYIRKEDDKVKREPAAWALRIVMTIGAIALIVSTCCIFGCGAMMPVITSGAEDIVGGATMPLVLMIVFTVIAWFCCWQSLRKKSSNIWGVVAVVCAFLAAYWARYVFYAMQISIGL